MGFVYLSQSFFFLSGQSPRPQQFNRHRHHSLSRISRSVAFFNVQVHNTSKLLSTEIEDGQQGNPLLQIHLFPQYPAVRRSNV